MSFTIVKITTFYKDFLNNYYFDNQNIISQSYSEQYSHLMNQDFAWSNYFENHFKNKGLNAFEIIANARHLQNSWLKENGYSSNLDIYKTIILQLQKMKPEVVWFQDSVLFNGDFVKHLKTNIPSIKLMVGFCCSPFSETIINSCSCFDLMIVCSPIFIKQFESKGINTKLIYHGFEKSILAKYNLNNIKKEFDLSFTATFVPGTNFHESRAELISALLKANINFKLFGSIIVFSLKDLFLRNSAYFTYNFLKNINLIKYDNLFPGISKARIYTERPKNLTNYKLIQKKIDNPKYGKDLYESIAKSNICLNSHGGVSGKFAANMRMFEITGVGSCLLTDWKQNLSDLFLDEKEIVTYKNIDECIEKINWLIKNPIECDKIAKQGQLKTLSKHNLETRAEMVYSEIKNMLQ